MASIDPATDPSLRDLIWVGYHPRAAAPIFIAAGLVNVLVLSGRWYLDGLSELADRAGALAVFALAYAVWPGLLAVFLYRSVTFTYRLTDRMLAADFGFLLKRVEPILLSEVTAVVTGGGLMARWIGIGWVEVRTKELVLRMTGVRRPAVFAEQIRVAVEAIRKRQEP